MANLDTKSFVILKYQIPTEDDSTWHLCETYPKIVRMKWALRCARAAEHLAEKYPEVKKCNDLTQKYIDAGMPESMHKELDKASEAVARTFDHISTAAHAAAYHAVNAASAYYAANTYATGRLAATAAHAAAVIDYSISRHAAYATYNTTKWNQYIDWLIEELCEYEEENK